LILLRATPPPVPIVRWFERQSPGFWSRWLSAAGAALREIDDDGGGDTIITSWYRSPAQNRRVGGQPDSQHLVGLALDVLPGRLSVNEASGRFQEVGFIPVQSQSHLHIQTFPAGALRSAGVLDALGI